jgi:hypothetical protein
MSHYTKSFNERIQLLSCLPEQCKPHCLPPALTTSRGFPRQRPRSRGL